MTATAEDVITTLRSIDARLAALVMHFGCGLKPPPTPTVGNQVASAADLDGPFGDPHIKAKDPRDWTGDPMTGKRFSECPPAYLDLLADRFDYFADVAEEEGKVTTGGKPVAPYNRKDAARARGWAARLRAGWKPPLAATGFASDAASLILDEIPF